MRAYGGHAMNICYQFLGATDGRWRALFSQQSPCDDSRHLQIWPKHKSCARLPSFLVIGPPFGGLDVLVPFLKLHPDFLHIDFTDNATLGTSFFNTDNYMKGLDW